MRRDRPLTRVACGTIVLGTLEQLRHHPLDERGRQQLARA